MEDKQQNPIVEEYDATLEPDPVIDMDADELQESILEDSGMNAFQKHIARLDEKTWTLYQRIVGVLLGIASGIALFWEGGNADQNAMTWSLVLAIVIAMLIPNIIERQGLRRIPKLRVALVIALGVMIVGRLVIGLITGDF